LVWPFRSLFGRKEGVLHVRTKRNRKSEKDSAESGCHPVESEIHQSQSGNDQAESVRDTEKSSHAQYNRGEPEENSCETEVAFPFGKHHHAICMLLVVFF
jgi:hypothetical protein